MLAFTKPANNVREANIKQVNPALRLPAGRWQQIFKNHQNEHYNENVCLFMHNCMAFCLQQC
jgi:hypothetical protein